VAAAILAAAVIPLAGQSFNSQSDGSDGALDFTHVEPGTTVIFDPPAFDPPLDPDGDNVFHFTTINIPEGVTVQLRATELNWAPVHWLAGGEVIIDGVINLRGENGHVANPPTMEEWRPAIPGPGGFPGGVGGNMGRGTPGLGPGGGQGGADGPFPNGFQGDHNYGNIFLLPLTGGSGGGGGRGTTGIGGGGGAGGGAIQIASSVSITLNGTITAAGGRGSPGVSGAGNNGGDGAGGAVRLMAPVISGNGTINVAGRSPNSGQGWARLESFERLFTGNINARTTSFRIVTLAPGPHLGLPTSPAPWVRVASIAGQPVAATPSGSFIVPDAVIDTTDPVEVVIEASRIPLETTVLLGFINENQSDPQAATSTPLEGTEETSTATVEVTFPPGFSRGWVRATW
jgi:hypothetical protein